jgi:hypothetical protein
VVDLETKPRRTLTKGDLLPGRPPAGPEAGPEPDPNHPHRAKYLVRAICCSGGGVRAAAFALGGIQYLNEQPEGDGTFYSTADLVTSVSGGGYTAGSYAIVAHNLAPGAVPRVYAPGSPEDVRLRTRTKYLIDSKTQLSISILGIVYGLMMNLLAILTAGYIVAKVVGVILGKHGLHVLRLVEGGKTWQTDFPPELFWTLLAVFVAGALTYLIYRGVDTYRALGEVATKRWCVTALVLMAVAAASTVLLVVLPWVLHLLSRAPGKVMQIHAGPQTGTLFGTVAALVAIITQLVRSYAPTSDGSNPLISAVVKAGVPLRTKITSAVLPWLGSAILVTLMLVAMLTWVSNMAYARHEFEQWMAVIGCAVFLLAWQVLTDGNRTSLHRYYTQRLATAFAETRGGNVLDPPAPLFSAYRTEADRPHLVVCAAANTDQPGSTPSSRNCAPFTFSAYNCGISSGTMFRGERDGRFDLGLRETSGPDRLQWNDAFAPLQAARWENTAPDVGLSMDTAAFEDHANQLTLIDMVAVSGAAVSPAMGRMSRPSMRLLLGVADARLGMWLPNPLHRRLRQAPTHGVWSRIYWQLRQPGLLALAREIIGGLTFHGQWLYVTDGGHYENLGLVEALRRGATEIVAFDASGDTPFSLSTFGQAVETARTDLGVEIALVQADALAQDGTSGHAKALAAVARATYANGVVARIYLCKAARIADLPPDVKSWADGHPIFPNDSTANQFYGDREFEAYRRLGYQAGQQAHELARPDPAWVDPS